MKSRAERLFKLRPAALAVIDAMVGDGEFVHNVTDLFEKESVCPACGCASYIAYLGAVGDALDSAVFECFLCGGTVLEADFCGYGPLFSEVRI